MVRPLIGKLSDTAVFRCCWRRLITLTVDGTRCVHVRKSDFFFPTRRDYVREAGASHCNRGRSSRAAMSVSTKFVVTAAESFVPGHAALLRRGLPPGFVAKIPLWRSISITFI